MRIPHANEEILEKNTRSENRYFEASWLHMVEKYSFCTCFIALNISIKSTNTHTNLNVNNFIPTCPSINST